MQARLLLRQSAKEQKVNYQGIPVTVEWPKNSVREGTNERGEKWTRKMLCDYGRVEDTRAKGDHEELDVYLGPDQDASTVWVVEQLKTNGEFDEPKCMLGFDSERQALAMYLAHYPKGWERDRVGDVYPVPVEDFRKLISEEQERVQEV